MRRKRYDALAEINITNLVDVTMVLLIVFMLTAPFLQSGVRLNLPKAEAKVIEEKEGVTVSVDGNGDIYIDDRLVTWEDFSAEFRRAIEVTAPRVFLRGDSDTKYGTVMKVIARIKMLGVEDLGLIAEQEDKN